MAETRPDAPRYLRHQDAQAADTSATVDVRDLLRRLAERTEEVAEARVRQKRAEGDLKEKTREMESEREAHVKARQQLETDCRKLEVECIQISEEYRGLEAKAAREREAGAAVHADLKRAQDRVNALQQQLQVVWAQLEQDRTESEPRPWWGRSGS